MNPKDEVVIDIGANIVTIQIYFCVEGAKKVIASGPYPYTFKLLSENVNINGCEEKIIPLNEGFCPLIIIKEIYQELICLGEFC